MKPTGIKADRSIRVITINWDDGHQSHYSFDGLRTICPCVECKGGHANMGTPPDPRQVRDAPATNLMLENLQAVGSYALQPFWSDGHTTGIYTWPMLRQACPCDQCLPND
ncbi:MAG TPA: DUF971 domain-containing protein [Anaerolineae bacterium]|nr:DUF971 domain-containing protein [Anaerolineae bacterium]